MALTHNSVVSKSEPSWGSVSKGKLPRIAFAEKGEPDKKSTWGFPHHWVSRGTDKNGDGIFDGGTMYLHRGGLAAAWAAAKGARSGKKASPGVVAHLRKHYADLGIKKASFEGEDFDITEFDVELIEAGLLTEADLKIGPHALLERNIIEE